MPVNNIDFYYFSGTGNTLLIVKNMKAVFEKKGVVVTLFPIEKTDPSTINVDNTIGLAFPVAEQGTYPFVWDFVNALPQAEQTDVFMVDTLLAFSGGIVGPLKKIVQKKGYTPIGALEILMPNNLFPKKIDADKVAEKVEKGMKKSTLFAESLLDGTANWGRIPVISDMMSVFSKSELSWRFLRGFYRLAVDTEKCVSCGLCAKLCPIDNITMNTYPEFQDRCTICMRCVSFCPTEAISIPKKEHDRYKAVKASELL